MVQMLVNWLRQLRGWLPEQQYSALRRLGVPEEAVEAEISLVPGVDEELMMAEVVERLAARKETRKMVVGEARRNLEVAEEERKELRLMKACVSQVEVEVSCRSVAVVVPLSGMLLR